MQLTGIILLAAVLQVSARGNAQTVTYSTRATSLPNVFAAIERQTGYVFFYDKQDLQTATPVTVKLQDAPLQEAMEMILRGEPLGFAIRGNTIFITLKAPAATQPEAPAPSPNQDISGKILNEKGEPAEGVSISIKGSTIGVQTDAKGEFTLHDVPASAIIVVSHVGYEVQEIKVKDRRDFFIKLKVSAQTLADMRVTVSNGIFSLPRERATGSYDYIGPELINRSVSTNILDRLNGVASGVLFDNTAGNSINMQIRGMSTIQSNTQPLIVLNGMAFDGDLSTINPNDVESITILKDAAAASIWGVRAGNGVVVITTKKGRYNQPLRIDINSNVTTSSRPNLFYNPNFLDANDFINVEQQLYANGYYASQLTDPSEPPISPVVSLLDSANKGLVSQSYANNQINSYRNLDVRNDEKKYFYRPQVLQQYSASLTGGNDKANFLLSAGWDKNLASQVGNDYSRITINSMNTFSPIKGLELTAGLTYIQSSTNQDNTLSQLSTGGSYGLEGILPYGMLADSKGNPLPLLTGYNTNFVNQVAPSLGFLNWQFYPLEELRNHYNTTNTTESDIRAIAGLRYHIFSGLSVEGKYQYERAPTAGIQDQTQQSYATRNLINLYSNQDGNGNVIGYNIPVGDILGYNYNTLESQNFRAQLDFDKKWDNNILTIVVGYEARELTNSYNTYNVYGYSPSSSTSQTVDYVDAFYNNYGGGNIPSGITNGETINRYRSYFGNAGYTYKSKYTLSASGRIDQSNLFGVATNQKTVPLYSAGFKWDIDKEAFFNLSWLNTLKARLTYGYSGNTNNSIYAYPTALYLSGSSPYGSYTQAALSSPGDPDLRWERSAMVNAGIDFGLFKNVFSGSLDYYARRGTDLIGNAPIQSSAGVNNLTGNYSDMKGNGVDLKLDAQILKGAFKWNVEFLGNYTANKVTKYLGSASGTDYNIVVGKPVTGLYGLKWAGLDPANGDPRGYLDDTISKNYSAIYSQPLTSTGNKLQTSSSWVYKGPAQPTFFGGFRNTFSYKNISLSANITFKAGYYFKRSSINYSSLFGLWEGNRDFTRRWQKTGDEKLTNVPSMPNLSSINSTRGQFYAESEVLLDKGDQVRLQDINLSYNLTKSMWRKMPFNNFQIYSYMSNIGLLWKANKDKLDPDVPTGIPTPRTIAFGIRTSF